MSIRDFLEGRVQWIEKEYIVERNTSGVKWISLQGIPLPPFQKLPLKAYLLTQSTDSDHVLFCAYNISQRGLDINMIPVLPTSIKCSKQLNGRREGGTRWPCILSTQGHPNIKGLNVTCFTVSSYSSFLVHENHTRIKLMLLQ